MRIPIQDFHRGLWKSKKAGYLLITQSFPHSPHLFPQGFSTGGLDCGYSFLVHITSVRGNLKNPTFRAVVDFHQGEFFVQKLGA